MQFVEVELDPGESVVAEAGALMYMTPAIAMETVFGDGSAAAQTGGFMGKLLGAGKRLLTGESLFMTVFTNTARSGKHRVAFAAPYPGRILPMDLKRARRRADLPEGLVPLRRARACRSASRSSARSARACSAAKASSCSGCRATASASCTPAACSRRIDLAPGETLRVDTGCLVALQPPVNYDIQFVGKVKTAFFGGEGLFFATLHRAGPRLAAVAAAQPPGRSHPQGAPGVAGGRKEEGGVLDRLRHRQHHRRRLIRSRTASRPSATLR